MDGRAIGDTIASGFLIILLFTAGVAATVGLGIGWLIWG